MPEQMEKDERVIRLPSGKELYIQTAKNQMWKKGGRITDYSNFFDTFPSEWQSVFWAHFPEAAGDIPIFGSILDPDNYSIIAALRVYLRNGGNNSIIEYTDYTEKPPTPEDLSNLNFIEKLKLLTIEEKLDAIQADIEFQKADMTLDMIYTKMDNSIFRNLLPEGTRFYLEKGAHVGYLLHYLLGMHRVIIFPEK